ncbi:GIY-YIG nuclease family protein [Pseudomonas chlororaphis]|uniref:GIY-YIG nuclease family protein n=1 Tax=Pseudomonas chlororaphis TaxID=587753 RepID=UPI000F4AAD11|nr:GIY-YIG nuclease family protein [Pseudomonas chlororaphis]WDH21731.1 GIY-YIG nuclease family protein [Pseudomonas chlororaphis]WDH34325.1 GIY-YIG nuclease family protein [Pseudomonas chlororaphis]WDH40409.1 GIY-YIG nuclease family protein [Pseudomonas chlororaphis]
MTAFSDYLTEVDFDAFFRCFEKMELYLTESSNSLSLSRSEVYSADPGVYCIYEDDALIYVGETGSLKARMQDLFKTVNHSFRRSFGKAKFSHLEGVTRVSAKDKFPEDVEVLVTKYMEENLRVVILPILIGRKEVEESIVRGFAPIFNSRGRRV